MNRKKYLLSLLFILIIFKPIRSMGVFEYLYQNSGIVQDPRVQLTATLAVAAGGYLGWQGIKYANSPQSFTPSIQNCKTCTFIPNNDATTPEKLSTTLAVATDMCSSGPLPAHIIKITKNDNTEYWHAHQGVPAMTEQKLISIYANGYAWSHTPPKVDSLHDVDRYKGATASVLKVPKKIANGTLPQNVPAVAFDFPDDRRRFNFGQSLDLSCFNAVYNEAQKNNSQAQFVCIGLCRGASVLLQTLANKTNVKALVLESPYLSLKSASEQMSKKFLPVPGGSVLVHTFFKWFYPNYTPCDDNVLLNAAQNIPNTVPILIAHLKGDQVVSDESIKRLIHCLKQTGNNNVNLFVVKNKPNNKQNKIEHGFIASTRSFQSVSNAFFKQCGISCDEQLAKEGSEYLANALFNSTTDISQWRITADEKASVSI